MISIINITKAWLRWLQTDGKPGAVGKALRLLLMLPLFSALIALLRLQLLLGKQAVLQGETVDATCLRCRPPDLIQTYIVLFGVWEPDLSQFLRQRLDAGKTFIDVGANIGYFSLLASRLVGESGQVVAIDALPSNFSELQHNLAANAGTANVRAINRAVSDQPGHLDVYAGPAHNVGLATTAPGERQELQRAARIEAAPLSDLLSSDEIRAARLLKIDVEGAEAAVLAGMGEFLAACHPELEILVELSPGWWSDPDLTPEGVLAPLRAAGFNTYLMENNYWPWRYLWPGQVSAPKRVQRLPDRRVKRIDLVLSRRDEDYLPIG